MSRIKSPFQKWLYRNRLEIKVALALVIIFLGVFTYFRFFYKSPILPDPQIRALSMAQDKGVRFVQDHLTYRRGVIKQFDPLKSSQEKEYLSETLGLWMVYLVDTQRQSIFDKQVSYLKRYFLSPEDWVYWRIDQSTPSSCNASLDDLRIAFALARAGKVWKQKKYLTLSAVMARRMKKINLRDNYFVESYCQDPVPDISFKVDLSYLDLPAMAFLTQFDKDWQAVLYRSQKLLDEGKTPAGFYFDKYLIDKSKYGLQDMNLINQLICAQIESQMNARPSKLYLWLKKEYLTKGKIYGRYHPLTLKALVDYESPAVYGLMLSLAVFQNDLEFAQQLAKKLLLLQNNDGSFGQAPFEAFDHILILTGLRHYQTFVEESMH
jgi:hypothetical protein